MVTTYEPGEIVSCRNSIMTYIINAASTKIPFKERDIMAQLNRNNNLFKIGFTQATECLRDIYGIKVEAVPNSKIGKCYICYSEIKTNTLLLLDEEQKRHLTLLFVILSYIFMRTTPSTQAIGEENLINFLKDLDIHIDKEHEFFGKNIKKLITETFVKQLYLQRTRCVSEFETESKFQYSWGHRAKVEFDKKLLLNATAKILNKPPSAFDVKYKEVYGHNVDCIEGNLVQE